MKTKEIKHTQYNYQGVRGNLSSQRHFEYG